MGVCCKKLNFFQWAQTAPPEATLSGEGRQEVEEEETVKVITWLREKSIKSTVPKMIARGGCVIKKPLDIFCQRGQFQDLTGLKKWWIKSARNEKKIVLPVTKNESLQGISLRALILAKKWRCDKMQRVLLNAPLTGCECREKIRREFKVEEKCTQKHMKEKDAKKKKLFTQQGKK